MAFSRSTSGYSAAIKFLEFLDRGPLDRLARDRTFEDEMSLVLGIDGQLVVELVAYVDVREDARLVVLDHLFALDVEHVPFPFEQTGDHFDAVRKEVDVDIGTFADMASHHAADEARPEPAEQAHQVQSVQAHVAQIGDAGIAFLGARKTLNQVADFRIRREIVRFDVAAAKALCGFAFRCEVLGLHAIVHQAGSFEGNGMTETNIGHPFYAPDIRSPFRAARGFFLS